MANKAASTPVTTPVNDAPKADPVKLFQAYHAANKAYQMAMTSAATANEERSAAVKAIKEGMGVGPFALKDGTVLKVMVKKEVTEDEAGNKTATGKETYFFRCIVVGGSTVSV